MCARQSFVKWSGEQGSLTAMLKQRRCADRKATFDDWPLRGPPLLRAVCEGRRAVYGASAAMSATIPAQQAKQATLRFSAAFAKCTPQVFARRSGPIVVVELTLAGPDLWQVPGGQPRAPFKAYLPAGVADHADVSRRGGASVRMFRALGSPW